MPLSAPRFPHCGCRHRLPAPSFRPIGRQSRRDLTALLNLAWSAQQPPPPATSTCVGPWQRDLPCTRLRRRRGRLFEAQRRQWRRQPSLQHWAGWPTRGVRYGEASHPGPEPGRARSASPGRGRPHANNYRVFCPVMLSLLRCFFGQRLDQPCQHASPPQRPLCGLPGRGSPRGLPGPIFSQPLLGVWASGFPPVQWGASAL